MQVAPSMVSCGMCVAIDEAALQSVFRCAHTLYSMNAQQELDTVDTSAVCEGK
jgi:hypothetical protein